MTPDARHLIKLTLLIMLGFGDPSWAPLDQQELQQLTARESAPLDYFGSSIAVSGNRVLVGAPRAFHGSGAVGSVFSFRGDCTRWIEEQRIIASDGRPDEGFGCSVAVSGDRALVGARYADRGAGAWQGCVYALRHDGKQWVEQQILTASDAKASDSFGISVSLEGDVALIGAPGSDNHGAAYMYRHDGSRWLEEQKLTPSKWGEDDFGFSVSLSGDRALIGAIEARDWFAGPGSAYVFRRKGKRWSEEQRLVASDGHSGARFGLSVSLSGDLALVGAPEHRDSGASYVFRYDGKRWIEDQKLVTREPSSYLGESTALSGTTALIGAPWHGSVGDRMEPGFAYLFRYDGLRWVEERRLSSSDGSKRDQFGNAVYLGSGFAFAGAPNHDVDGDKCRGAVYVFELPRSEKK